MADMLKRVPVREQDAKVRATNFEEVCYGYNKEEAMEEAARCLNCKNAKCIQGCPVSINIPGFISKVKEGDSISDGQVVVILEAMKMENEIVAAKAGVLAGIHVKEGQVVNPGDALITIN